MARLLAGRRLRAGLGLLGRLGAGLRARRRSWGGGGRGRGRLRGRLSARGLGATQIVLQAAAGRDSGVDEAVVGSGPPGGLRGFPIEEQQLQQQREETAGQRREQDGVHRQHPHPPARLPPLTAPRLTARGCRLPGRRSSRAAASSGSTPRRPGGSGGGGGRGVGGGAGPPSARCYWRRREGPVGSVTVPGGMASLCGVRMRGGGRNGNGNGALGMAAGRAAVGGWDGAVGQGRCSETSSWLVGSEWNPTGESSRCTEVPGFLRSPFADERSWGRISKREVFSSSVGGDETWTCFCAPQLTRFYQQSQLKSQTGEENVKFKCWEDKASLPPSCIMSMGWEDWKALNDAELWFETRDSVYEFFIGLVTGSWNAWVFNRAFL